MVVRRLPVLVSLLVTLAGCGVAPQLGASPTSVAHSRDLDYTGSYLSLEFEPTREVADTADQIRNQLGFVDMTHAIPARKGDALHVTVGYFQTLAPRDAEAIAEHFRGHEADLVVNGYGVANNQAAYFTVDGLEDARGELKGMAIAFSADDPHVTFGVSPANPRDVHNVPKKAQFAMGPFKVHALFHLQQGTKTFW